MSLIGLDRSVPVALDFLAHPEIQSALGLLRAEKAEFEAVFGTPVDFVSGAAPGTQRWVIRFDPTAGAATLAWDPKSQVLTSTAADAEGFGRSLNLLHTLAWSPDNIVTDRPAASSAAAFDRVYTEILNTYPAFELRGLDWEQITERHRGVRERDGTAFLAGVQQWVAELGDAHTSVRAPGPRFHPDYLARMTASGAVLVTVPPESPAHRAGVRRGWVVEVDDPDHWLTTTGATPQQYQQVAARRFLAMSEATRTFTARSETGGRVRWIETAAAPGERSVLRWRRDRARGRVYARLSSFSGLPALAGEFDTMMAETADSDELVLDLRGNTGGALVSATALRDRFLRARTELGTIRFTTGTGGLGPAVKIVGEPSTEPTWPGHLIVLTDAMTYSASEDFLLGLQGLAHVTVLGEPTGGGSGRPRSLAVTAGLTLTISTALTYDREGRCVELNGIAVDGPTPRFARSER